jgi:hypothetical protein
VKRFSRGMDGNMERDDDGDWVRGDDAQAEVERLRARVAELKGHLAGKPLDRAAVLSEPDAAEASVDAALAAT